MDGSGSSSLDPSTMSETSELPAAAAQPKFKVGDFVFARYPRYPPWPARIVEVNDCAVTAKTKKQASSQGIRYVVFFYGENTQEKNIPQDSIWPYEEFKQVYGESNKKSAQRRFFVDGIHQLEEDLLKEAKGDSEGMFISVSSDKKATAEVSGNKQSSDCENSDPCAAEAARKGASDATSDVHGTSNQVPSASDNQHTGKTDVGGANGKDNNVALEQENNEKSSTTAEPERRRSRRAVAQSKRLSDDFVVDIVKPNPRDAHPASESQDGASTGTSCQPSQEKAPATGKKGRGKAKAKVQPEPAASTTTRKSGRLAGRDTADVAPATESVPVSTPVSKPSDSKVLGPAPDAAPQPESQVAETQSAQPEADLSAQTAAETKSTETRKGAGKETNSRSRLRSRAGQSVAPPPSPQTSGSAVRNTRKSVAMKVDVPKLEIVYVKSKTDVQETESADCAVPSAEANKSDAVAPSVGAKAESTEHKVEPQTTVENVDASNTQTVQKTAEQVAELKADSEMTDKAESVEEPEPKKSSESQSHGNASTAQQNHVSASAQVDTTEAPHSDADAALPEHVQPAKKKAKKRAADDWLFEEKLTLKPKRVKLSDSVVKTPKTKSEAAETSAPAKRELELSEKRKPELDVDSELQNGGIRLRDAVQKEDVEACVSAMKKLARVSVSRSALHNAHELVHVLKRCRKIEFSEHVRDCAEVLYSAWYTLTRSDTPENHEIDKTRNAHNESKSKVQPAKTSLSNPSKNVAQKTPAKTPASKPPASCKTDTDKKLTSKTPANAQKETESAKLSKKSEKSAASKPGFSKTSSAMSVNCQSGSSSATPTCAAPTVAARTKTGFTKPGSLNISVSVSLPPPVVSKTPAVTNEDVMITKVTKTPTVSNSAGPVFASASTTPLTRTVPSQPRVERPPDRPPTPVIPLSSDSDTSPVACPPRPAPIPTSSHAPVDLTDLSSPVKCLDASNGEHQQVNGNGIQPDSVMTDLSLATCEATCPEVTSKEVVTENMQVD